jgi:hypothetical protein
VCRGTWEWQGLGWNSAKEKAFSREVGGWVGRSWKWNHDGCSAAGGVNSVHPTHEIRKEKGAFLGISGMDGWKASRYLEAFAQLPFQRCVRVFKFRVFGSELCYVCMLV